MARVLSSIICLRLPIAALPSAILRRISGLDLASSFTWEPKSTKSFTTSSLSPSTSKSVTASVVIIFVFLMLRKSPNSALLALMVEIRFFNPFNDSAMSVVSSAYRKLLMQRPPTRTLSLTESISALRMIVSVYRLNRYGKSIQPWRTPLPI